MRLLHPAVISWMVVLLVVVAGMVWGLATGRIKSLKRWPFLASTLPHLFMILLLTTLAGHIYSAMGRWPPIGEEGFPGPLLMHASFAIFYFMLLWYTTMFLWPLAMVVCASVPAWRPALAYLAIYYLGMAAVFGVLALLPSGFQYWWWD